MVELPDSIVERLMEAFSAVQHPVENAKTRPVPVKVAVDMASPEGYWRPVLVPEKHRKAVETYVAELEALDEVENDDRAGRRPPADEGSDDSLTVYASPKTVGELRN